MRANILTQATLHDLRLINRWLVQPAMRRWWGSPVSTGILQELCVCHMSRCGRPERPEEQVCQHRSSLFMGPDPLHNERLPDKAALLGAPDLLGETGDCPGRLV